MQNGNIPSSYSVPVSASLAFFLSRFRRFTPLSFACFLAFTSRKQTDESSSLEGKFTRLLAHARLALKSWPPSWIGEPRNPGMSTIERPRVWDWDELGKGGGGFLPPLQPSPSSISLVPIPSVRTNQSGSWKNGRFLSTTPVLQANARSTVNFTFWIRWPMYTLTRASGK